MTETGIGWLSVPAAFALTYGFLSGCQRLGRWLANRDRAERTVGEERAPCCAGNADIEGDPGTRPDGRHPRQVGC